eukprot:TRINITY_DN781_c0_g1_i2.p1 TRINITY_DN781_c0_g1~~TRINITY_DN781_c0_g1_i2.p1  ORF type:complete len:245 (-),score=55.25 TRINITY_DN781_c0_g1_i2:352-1086(-)
MDPKTGPAYLHLRALCGLTSVVLLLLPSFFPPAHAIIVEGSNVTLAAITLYNKFNWYWSPKVFFRCRGEKEVNLPAVTEILEPYDFSKDPNAVIVATLTGIECKFCGLYQRMWFTNEEFDAWEICPLDFDSSTGLLTRLKEGVVNITLQCIVCNRHGHFSSHNSGGGAAPGDYSSSMSVIVLMLLSVAAIAVTAALASVAMYLAKRAEQTGPEDPEAEEEKERFILELTEETEQHDEEKHDVRL